MAEGVVVVVTLVAKMNRQPNVDVIDALEIGIIYELDVVLVDVLVVPTGG